MLDRAHKALNVPTYSMWSSKNLVKATLADLLQISRVQYRTPVSTNLVLVFSMALFTGHFQAIEFSVYSLADATGNAA